MSQTAVVIFIIKRGLNGPNWLCAVRFLVLGGGFLDGEEGILLYLTGVISTTAEHVGVCK